LGGLADLAAGEGWRAERDGRDRQSRGDYRTPVRQVQQIVVAVFFDTISEYILGII